MSKNKELSGAQPTTSRTIFLSSGRKRITKDSNQNDVCFFTAKEFLDYLYEKQGNLKDLSYRVIENIIISSKFNGYSLYLGEGVFEGSVSFRDVQLKSVSFQKANFWEDLTFEETNITKLSLGQSTFCANICFGDLKTEIINCNQAMVLGNVHGEHWSARRVFSTKEAYFRGSVSLGSLHTSIFSAGEASFNTLHLGEFWTDLFSTGNARVVKLIYPSKGRLDHTGERFYKGTPQIHNIKLSQNRDLPVDSLEKALLSAVSRHHSISRHRKK